MIDIRYGSSFSFTMEVKHFRSIHQCLSLMTSRNQVFFLLSLFFLLHCKYLLFCFTLAKVLKKQDKTIRHDYKIVPI